MSLLLMHIILDFSVSMVLLYSILVNVEIPKLSFNSIISIKNERTKVCTNSTAVLRKKISKTISSSTFKTIPIPHTKFMISDLKKIITNDNNSY